MHRFFLQRDIPESGNLILHERPLIHQMGAVLKLKVGESVALFNGSGRDFEFRIAKISPQAAFGHIMNVSLNKRDPIRRVCLYQSLVKKNNFEWILQKCTELGVKKFIPIISDRSVKKGLNRERAEKIIREAVEQSGQDTIPEITEPIALFGVLANINKEETIIFCDQSGTALPSEKFPEETPLHPALARKGWVHIFVGPEGGFSEKEISAVRERGGEILSLGQRILRAETAAIAVVSLVLTPLEV